MNRIFSIVMMMLLPVVATAQNADLVIMKINGHNITRSEFEYSYNKNNTEDVIDKKDVQDYVQLYIDYKLKVEAAKDAGLDTLKDIRTELQGYREQMVYPTLENPAYVEEQAYQTYKRTLDYYGTDDLIDCQHILVLMRQDATAAQQAAAKQRIDSIYNCLMSGQDFAELATKHSDDMGSAARGGKLPRFGKGRMIPEFEAAAYALKPGEISKPVKTVAGWHIIKMNGRAPFGSFAEHHDKVVEFLKEQPGFQEAAAEALIDSLAKQRGVSKDEVFGPLFENLIAKDSDARNLAQEYYDGTLMFEISKNQVWDKAANDKEGLAQYFKKNKKKYSWTEPHFRGIVVHAKDKETINLAKKMVKKLDPSEWANTIVKTFNTDDDKKVRVEPLSIFKKGDNRFVDKYEFGSTEEVKEFTDYPYSQTVGKLLKKPKEYIDVRNQLLPDYQREKENEWVMELRKKYPVEVYQDVVNTVNNH